MSLVFFFLTSALKILKFQHALHAPVLQRSVASVSSSNYPPHFPAFATGHEQERETPGSFPSLVLSLKHIISVSFPTETVGAPLERPRELGDPWGLSRSRPAPSLL